VSGFEANFALTKRKKRPLADSKIGRPGARPLAERREIRPPRPSVFIRMAVPGKAGHNIKKE